jgi:hypothetical protein
MEQAASGRSSSTAARFIGSSQQVSGTNRRSPSSSNDVPVPL